MAERNEAVRNSSAKPKNKRGKKRHSSYILLYISLIVLAVIIITVLSLTVFFPIKSIETEGESRYSSEEIIDASNLDTGTNLFTTNTTKAENNITKKLPYISSVRTIRKFPSTLILSVTAAEEYAQIESGDKYYIIDKDKKCLNVQSKKQKGVTVIRGLKINSVKEGENITLSKDENKDSLTLIDSIISGADERGLNLTVLNVSDTQGLWATYDNRIVLLFGSENNLTDKYDYALKVIEQRKNSTETGTLNLSRIPNTKNQVSFIPGELDKEKIA